MNVLTIRYSMFCKLDCPACGKRIFTEPEGYCMYCGSRIPPEEGMSFLPDFDHHIRIETETAYDLEPLGFKKTESIASELIKGKYNPAGAKMIAVIGKKDEEERRIITSAFLRYFTDVLLASMDEGSEYRGGISGFLERIGYGPEAAYETSNMLNSVIDHVSSEDVQNRRMDRLVNTSYWLAMDILKYPVSVPHISILTSVPLETVLDLVEESKKAGYCTVTPDMEAKCRLVTALGESVGRWMYGRNETAYSILVDSHIDSFDGPRECLKRLHKAVESQDMDMIDTCAAAYVDSLVPEDVARMIDKTENAPFNRGYGNLPR
jgi:hypothetical protein